MLVKGKRLTEGKWFKQLQELGSLELEACCEASHVETRRELILQSKSWEACFLLPKGLRLPREGLIRKDFLTPCEGTCFTDSPDFNCNQFWSTAVTRVALTKDLGVLYEWVNLFPGATDHYMKIFSGRSRLPPCKFLVRKPPGVPKRYSYWPLMLGATRSRW